MVCNWCVPPRPWCLTTEDLGAPHAPAVPLGGHLVPEALGEGEHLGQGQTCGRQPTHLGVLGVLRPQVLVQVPDDVWSDLEGTEEHEEEAEEDVEAADDEALAHPAKVQVA